MNRMVAGALAGLAATAPMTVSMLVMHRRLPREEQYALPPAEVTQEFGERAGLADDWDAGDRLAVTGASHFGFGAAAGALFPLVEEHLPGPVPVRGTLYAMGVWSLSYMGWIPALHLLKPATEHPPRRNALMIAAHVVWGSVMALLARRLQQV